MSIGTLKMLRRSSCLFMRRSVWFDRLLVTEAHVAKKNLKREESTPVSVISYAAIFDGEYGV